MSKCKDCKYFEKYHEPKLGYLHNGRYYCIAAPDYQTPEEHKHLIKPERMNSEDPTGPIYMVEPEDDCVVWFLDFKGKK